MAYIYDPKDKFGYKDTLPEGHAEKIIRGSEFDVEFNKIAGAFAVLDPDGDGDINIDNIDGLQDALDKERQERIEADADLQGQIDALDPNGDRNVGWDEIENKPTEFPPEPHGHEIADVNGLQDALNSAGGTPAWGDVTGKPTEFPPEAHSQDWSTITNTPADFPPSAHGHAWDDVTGKPTEFPPAAHNQDWSTITNTPSDYPPSAHDHAWDDVTGKPTEFPPEAHTHEQSEVDGLEDRLDAIEGSISSGGGFVDAPNDGKLYGRQSEAWAVVPSGGASSWDDLTDKPTEFPPAAHNQGWDTITDKPDDYPPSAHGHAWDEITGKPTEFPPASHNHDGVYQPVGDYIEDANSDGKQYARQDGDWSEIVIPDGGTGSSVHIGDTPPVDPQEGQQWMEVPASGEATMWIYDSGNDGQWLQQPGGKDGAAGADGNIADATTDGVVATWDDAAKQWTPDSSLTIDSSGDATFSGTVNASYSSMTNGTFYNNYSGSSGISFASHGMDPTDNTGSVSTGTKDIGSASSKWKDAYFSGTVSSGDTNGVAIGTYAVYRDGLAGIAFTNNVVRPATGAGVSDTGATLSIGEASYKFKDAFFSGTVNADAHCFSNSCGLRTASGTDIVPTSGTGGGDTSATHDLGSAVYKFRNGYFANQVITRSGVSIGTRDLIETLHTLREATKDEITIEGLRDAIGNAVGGLIEKFEAMQTASTQEISDE